MAVVSCRHFSGYKPCSKNPTCDEQCPHQDVAQISLLIVHLGALGAVVRSTALLRAIKRKYPKSFLTWVTDSPAHHLLRGHPVIDRVLTTQASDLLQLGALEFDIAFVVDKSLKAAGILKQTQVDQVFGFVSRPQNGAILPATPAAEELWSLGLDNQKKFHVNRKAEVQLVHEALELGPYRRDEYWLPLDADENEKALHRRQEWLSVRNKKILIGLNTGCSDVIPHKKLTVDYHRQLIKKISTEFPSAEIVLLGGPEDSERNSQIAAGLEIISSATNSGLRDGLISISCCDVVVTGDSLGMHMAISQQKQIVAWFGPTCAHEIDLFDRGIHVLTMSSCSPCWKRTCANTTMCYDQVSLEELVNAIKSCCSNGLFGRSTFIDSPA